MSTISALEDDEISFINPFLPTTKPSQELDGEALPFVTLTYACSLDGMISLSPGVRTTLSGERTKSMTHYLRKHHDAILVGAGTAVADNPSLNCRYPGVGLHNQPIPVVVDPNLRWQVEGSNVQQLAAKGRGKDILIVSGASLMSELRPPVFDVVTVAADDNRTIDWRDILLALSRRGIKSVMIEGGATIISSLLTQPELVDSVIVTIAPTWLGQGGVHVSPAARFVGNSRQNSASLVSMVWQQFGQDVVLCGRFSEPSISLHKS